MNTAPWSPKKRTLTNEDKKFIERVEKSIGKKPANVVECILKENIHGFHGLISVKQELAVRALAKEMQLELPC